VIATQTPTGSSFPEMSQELPVGVGQALTPKPCSAVLGPGFTVARQTLRPVASEADAVHGDGKVSLEALHAGKVRWKTRPMELLAVDAGYLAGRTARSCWSPWNALVSAGPGAKPRPYVYEVTREAWWRVGGGRLWPGRLSTAPCYRAKPASCAHCIAAIPTWFPTPGLPKLALPPTAGMGLVSPVWMIQQ